MPKPGTDGALAMGIIDSHHQRRPSSTRNMSTSTRVGFPELEERAADFTPEYAERITGVPGGRHRQVRARIRDQPALGHSHRASRSSAAPAARQAIRAVCAIPALTGSWRHVGGGLLQMPLWEFPVDWLKRLRGPTSSARARASSTSSSSAAALIGEMKLDPPIMALFIYSTNPVSQAPETNKIVRGPHARGSVHRRRRAFHHRHGGAMPTSCCRRRWRASPTT